MSSHAMEISLLGRTYSIACPQGQEKALLHVAQQLELQLTSLKARTNNLSREEIAIMAALNTGYDLLKEQQKNQDYNNQMNEKISMLQASIENALVERSIKED